MQPAAGAVQVFFLGAQLLPNRAPAPRRGCVRHVVLRRPRVLGHRRAVPGAVLPAPLPPAQGARARRDEEGGRQSTDGAGRRGFRRRSMGQVAAAALGPARKATDFHGRKGAFVFQSVVDRYT